MTSSMFASLALVLSLSQSPPSAKPDFSGTWTLDRSRSQSSEAAALIIKQNAAEISIETTSDGKTSTKAYPFEASPHPASETMIVGHTHASWDGAKLVTEVAVAIQGQTVSYRQVRSLNAGGTEMTLETLTIVQHGYTLKDGKNYSTTKDIYVRAK